MFRKKNFKNVFSENLPPEALLPPSGGCWEIRSKNPESKTSPERLVDEKGGFEDQLSYPELKSGVGKVSFQWLVKSDGLKTCAYGFVRCFAAIWHVPNHFLCIEVY